MVQNHNFLYIRLRRPKVPILNWPILLAFFEGLARGPLSIRKISEYDNIGMFSRLCGSFFQKIFPEWKLVFLKLKYGKETTHPNSCQYTLINYLFKRYDNSCYPMQWGRRVSGRQWWVLLLAGKWNYQVFIVVLSFSIHCHKFDLDLCGG